MLQVPSHPKQESHQEDKEICAQTRSTISLSDKSKILQQQNSLMKQFINNLDLKICAITETWLREGEEVAKATLKPDGYEILFSPCLSRLGGGIVIIHKENLWIAKSHEYQFKTCECTDFKISFDQCSNTLGLFYRPEDHPFLSFINDMLEYMMNSITDTSEFLLVGDFNIHIN